MGRFKQRWMTFVHALGRVQTAILLFLIYVLVIGPVSLLLRLSRRGDLLQIEKPAGGTTWSPKPSVPTDIARCERQF